MTVRIVLTGLLFCSSIGFSQAPDPCATAPQTCATLIETHATSEMRIPNTAVDVSVGVSASGKDLPEVQRALADQSNKLLAYLKGQQVERLITTRVSFAPDTRDRKSGPDKTVGYDGSARISFRAKPDKVADLLAGVLANGANTIESTIFMPTEQEIAEARRKLSEEATKTAIEQADAIAKAAGMKVVSVRNINVDNSDLQALLRSSAAVSVDEIGGGGGFVDRQLARNAPSPIQAESGDDQLSVSVNITAAATR
jgi:uncharacterized protein YggE